MSISAGSIEAVLNLNSQPFITGLNNARSQLSTFTDNTNSAGDRMTALGGIMTGVGAAMTKGVTVPLLAAGAGAVKTAADFEAGMSQVQALTGATGTEFEALSEQAKELGSTTMFSASQASDAMSELASAGFTTKEIMSAMPGLLDLAASGNVDLATAAGIASSTLRGFGLEANQATHVSDVLAEAAARTNAGITDMGGAMAYIAPVAAAMGISIEETAAAVGILSNSGIQGSKAGTVLRSALSSLAKPSKEASELMKQLGFNAYDANGKMLPLSGIIGGLQSSMSGLTDEQKQNSLVTMFGTEALSGMLALIEAGPDELNNLTEGFKNCDGSAKNMAETMQNNLKGKITAFKSALEGAGIAIGENFLPALTTIVEKVTGVVSAFGKLDSSTQKTIVKVGLVTAAIGPLLAIGGKLVTGIGSVIKVVSTVTSLVGTGLLSSLSIVLAPVAALAAGFYVWHEAVDAGNQSIAVAREEMSFTERAIADLTGMTTYSKDELIEMGLVFEDFNENISKEFQDSVEEMTLDIQDFRMSLNEINFDGVVTEEESNVLKERVSGALESCVKAIDEKYSEVQEGIKKAFSVDGAIDESEQSLIEYWNNRGNKEKEEAQKMQDEINAIIANARAEGRELNPAEIQAIEYYYEQIKQIELECQASNQYEIEYATQEFNNRVQKLDEDGAMKLLKQRYDSYQEQQIATKTNYDTLINLAKQGYEELDEAGKKNVDDTVARLENQKNEELRLNQERYDANVDHALKENEALSEIYNRYTGEQIARKDLENYQEYEQMRQHYENINSITESGYQKIFDTSTQTWKDLYVSIDETTGELKGVYDLNTQNVAAMTKSDESALRDEVANWQNTSEGILMNTILAGNAYQDLEGNIRNSSGEIIGHVEEVIDENGNLVQSIVDINGNKINIQGNWQEAINKANELNTAIQNIKDKTVTISVNQVGYANEKGSGFTPMYATGTDNALSGNAIVAEYGPEMILSKSAGAMLAMNRQVVNLEGGEKVLNARRTREMLKGNNGFNVGEIVDTIKTTTKEVVKAILSTDKGQTIHADVMNFNNEGSVERNISNVKRIVASMK